VEFVSFGAQIADASHNGRHTRSPEKEKYVEGIQKERKCLREVKKIGI